MFGNCSNLTKLDLSSFTTVNVTYMRNMFYYCFQNKATLICKASIIKKTTNKVDSCLTIENDDIKSTLNNNLVKIYKCSVKRKKKEINPKITDVEEYKVTSVEEYTQK